MSWASSWSTFHTLSLPTGAGKSNSRVVVRDLRRIIVPFSKACGGRMRHSSTMVVGEKLGAKSTPSTELLSPSSTVSRSTVSNWS